MRTEKIKSFLTNHWPLVFLVILGIALPLRWFADGRIIGGGDHFLYYNPTNVFSDYFYTWLERMNLGEPNFNIQLLFPFLSFFKFFELIGLSTFVSEILWAIYLFLFSGLLMYLLVLYLTRNEEKMWGKLAALVAAGYYMFNPYVMLDLLQITARPIQVVLPLLFLFLVKGLDNLESRNQSLKYPILVAFLSLLFASSNANIASIAHIIIAIFLYTLYFVLSHRNLFGKTILFSLKTLFFATIFNLWWIIPSVFAFRESGENIVKVISSYNFIGSTKIWEAVRLMGFWAFRINWSSGIPHIPFGHYYYEFPLLHLSYLFPFIALLGLVLKLKNKKLIFFAFLYLTGVFLAKGSNPPLGSVFRFFYDNFPLFNLFREPYSKFTPLTMFSLAVLLGLSWGYLVNLKPIRRWRLFLTTLFLCGNVFLAFPIVTGQSFQDPSWHGIKRDSLHVEIPTYWFEVGKWFRKTDPQARVILFPKSGYTTCYNWAMGTCSGEPVGRMFLPNQIVKYPGPIVYYRDSVLNKLYDSIFSGELKNFTPALGAIGVKYILQQNDLDWEHAFKDAYSPPQMRTLLKSQKGLKFVRSLGELDVYLVDENYISPWVYTVGDKALPEISFKRINPTRFEIEVSNVYDPYQLIFLSSFSKNWRVYLFPRNTKPRFFVPFGKASLGEDRHFIVNDFANGWYIKPEDVNQSPNYWLVLEYLPQKFFYLGLLISIGGVILSLGYLFIIYILKIKMVKPDLPPGNCATCNWSVGMI